MDRRPQCGHHPAMTTLLLTGGRVIDPATQTDVVADVLVVDGIDHRHRARPARRPRTELGADDRRADRLRGPARDPRPHRPARARHGRPRRLLRRGRPGRRRHGRARRRRRRHLRRGHVRHQPAGHHRPPRHPHPGAGLPRPQPALPGDQGLHLPQAPDRQRPQEPRHGVAGGVARAQRRRRHRAQGPGLPHRRPRALAVPRGRASRPPATSRSWCTSAASRTRR